MEAEKIANLILHIVLIVGFISAFFFVYVSNIEQKVVTSQVDRVIGGLTDDMKLVLNEDQKNAVSGMFKNLQPPDMSKDDEDAAVNNSRLLKKAAIILGIVVGMGILIVLILSYLFQFSFLELLKENIVTLLIAAATEFFFISFFARQYRSLDGNLVKYNVVQALQTYADS